MRKLLDPTSSPVARDVAVAARPASLRGLRLALVENTKFNSDALLTRLAERLARDHGLATTVMHRKRSPSHEVEAAAVAELRAKADVVISGIGD
ncbi:MAG TPA: hypothetical protein VLF19_07370 [Methylomirabilota bacterium]|nr:hypothetical protein [Methylomirabilota bacterium]